MARITEKRTYKRSRVMVLIVVIIALVNIVTWTFIRYMPESYGLPRFVDGYEILAVKSSINTTCFGRPNLQGLTLLVIRSHTEESPDGAFIFNAIVTKGIVKAENLTVETLPWYANTTTVISRLISNDLLSIVNKIQLGGCVKFGGPPKLN